MTSTDIILQTKKRIRFLQDWRIWTEVTQIRQLNVLHHQMLQAITRSGLLLYTQMNNDAELWKMENKLLFVIQFTEAEKNNLMIMQ